MYRLRIREKLEKKLQKLEKKDKKRYEQVFKKAEEIIRNPHHYKNLRSPQQHLKRVHVDSNSVLLFSVDDEGCIVMLEEFKHHDEAYER